MKEQSSMVDFALSDTDLDILSGIAEEAKASEKYARHYDAHEDEILPKAFAEAAAFPSLLERMRRRPSDDTPSVIMQMLIRIEREAHNGVPLRQATKPMPARISAAPKTPLYMIACQGVKKVSGS